MSAEAIETAILVPMQRLWTPKRGVSVDEARATLQDYTEALGGFSEPDLQAAWRDVRDSWDKASWPPPATFVKAALSARKVRRDATGEAKKEIRAQKREPKAWDTWAQYWHFWEIARCTDMAVEAADAEVAWSFKCMILNGAPVETISLTMLGNGRRRALEVYDLVRNGQPLHDRGTDRPLGVLIGDDARVMLGQYDSMLVREEETAREIRLYAGNKPTMFNPSEYL